MDYTISNNARLFDDLLHVLNKHQNEPGVVTAIEDLRAARVNYVQRSLDHMLSCLILTLHDLIAAPPSEALWSDLKTVIQRFHDCVFQAGPTLTELAHQYEINGGTLLSREEILREVDERRGTVR